MPAKVRPRRARRWIIAFLGAAGVVAAVLSFVAFSTGTRCETGTASVFSTFYRISSGAMTPTLEPGDRVLADRGYFCQNDPRRGDLAFFARERPAPATWIRRIVGLPGDRVQLRRGQLVINGEPVARDWIESAIHSGESDLPSHQTRFAEYFPDGARYEINVADDDAAIENTAEVTVPPGQYFVLGDDRDNSVDSRQPDFGTIARAMIADRPSIIVWGRRWDRVGLRVE